MTDSANTETRGPLHGLRIIEMAALGPVPFSGMMLSDLGADVIRVERLGGAAMGLPMDPRFDIMSRGRRSIAIDLKSEQGIELVLKLVASADGLMEGMRPGAMERLGLGPEPCMARKPSLVYGRMTGWGQTGPLAQKAGHDINYIALNGVLHSIGLADGPPVPPINLVGDYGGGSMFLLVGMLAALFEARFSGKGQVVDAAMLEGSSYLLSTIHMFLSAGMWKPQRGRNLLDGGAPFYTVYETADGGHMAVGAIEPKFYAGFVAGLGLDIKTLPPPLDESQWPQLRNTFAEVFKSRTRRDWEAVFEQRDACVTPVLSIEEARQHEHNRARANFVGTGDMVQPHTAPRFSRSTVRADARPTPPGKHGREILQELGLSDTEIDSCGRESVVALDSA